MFAISISLAICLYIFIAVGLMLMSWLSSEDTGADLSPHLHVGDTTVTCAICGNIYAGPVVDGLSRCPRCESRTMRCVKLPPSLSCPTWKYK